MIDKVKIENAALEIYYKHIKRGSPAQSLTKILQNEGLWFSEIENTNEDFLGALIKIESYPLHIMVRKDIEPIGRKNFTIAHELGHFALGHHLHSTSFFCNKSDITEDEEGLNEQEKEANYFASCFLMPRERTTRGFTNWFKHKFPQADKVFLRVETHGKQYSFWKSLCSNLAKELFVSETALKFRLVEFGLINNF